MIPKNINREHIIKAIEEIKKVGTPDGRSSKKFLLGYNGEYYPPKYIISLANKYANGKELDSQKFGGGAETNDFLKHLGFNLVEAPSKSSIIKPLKENSKTRVPITHHDERCAKCKETIKELLEKIHGKVEQNYKFEIGTHPEDFKNTSYYNKLKDIYAALQNHRGFKEFIKAKTLPNCDFFVLKPGFIVEFDESQHFTEPRRIALENYPEKLELGFGRERWIELCKRIKAKDNDPPYRDEQRAWYDTLRDFLPTIKGSKPTVRLFAKDYVWCSFDPNNSSDVERFENILKGTSGRWEIKVIEEPNPSIARVIIAGEWEGNPIKAKQLLEDICEKWPKGRKVKFLITCGGFIQSDWPESISWRDIGDNKNPNKESVDALVKKAEKCAKSVLSSGLDKKIGEFTDYITLGIDSYKNPGFLKEPHIELIVLIDLKSNKWHWTGKSYPLTEQQNGLLRIDNLKSHFTSLPKENLMILGCHDLKIFDPRQYKRKNLSDWKKKVIADFHRFAKEVKPVVVLQHPHTTDCVGGIKIDGKYSPGTWDRAWDGLKKLVPAITEYASAGKYYNSDGERSRLDEVLKKTKCGNAIDFIFWRNKE